MTTIGCIMCDIAGYELTAQDREVLSHPAVGGIILFSRNFESCSQVKKLTSDIRAAAKQPILITVDQEGGRVQRFQKGFSRIPAMRELGEAYQENPQKALQLALNFGTVLATELRAVGVDLSFTPVLDIDYQRSLVIGDRAFHRDPEIIIMLADALIRGLRIAGMHAVGKHFPGHGFVEEDSHVAQPTDARSFEEIFRDDLRPFSRLIAMGQLSAVMPAHIVFPAVDALPVGFSSVWLKSILREQLQFTGAIFFG